MRENTEQIFDYGKYKLHVKFTEGYEKRFTELFLKIFDSTIQEEFKKHFDEKETKEDKALTDVSCQSQSSNKMTNSCNS